MSKIKFTDLTELGDNITPEDLGSKRPIHAVCIVRYGAFGDSLQVATVFKKFKDMGCYLALHTHPRGADILHGDPHLDELIITTEEQMPKSSLTKLWETIGTKFTYLINLCESVEVALLIPSNRPAALWQKKARHKLCNHNYLELMHDIVGMEYDAKSIPDKLFYPSVDELIKISEFKASVNHKKILLWCLAGSSLHKVTPYSDYVINKILKNYNDVHIVLAGDKDCAILESEFVDNPRVTCTSGIWSIREVLTLAQKSDAVFGPETGVLNCVAFDSSVAKIVMLSHSTVENLTRDWRNVYNLVPDCECYPCHILHSSNRFCTVDRESRASACTVNIHPNEMYSAIVKALNLH